MDRPIVYPGELPRTTDFLGLAKDALYGFGHVIEAAIGSNVGIAGLAIAPTGPPSLSFTIGRGSIYQTGAADATAYSSLGTDATTIGKQGINPSPVTLTVTPPTTTGYSRYDLVQVAYADTDTGSTVLPYLNSSNSAAPYSGPANAGTSQNTIRAAQLVVQLLPGTAASTGSETVPSPTAGWTPVYVVHSTHGDTVIDSTHWYTHPSAPFFPNLESLKTTFVSLIPTTDFYVNNSTGSDSNDGLSATAAGTHGPWLTLAHAISALALYNFGGQAVTIHLGNSGTTYANPPPFIAPSSGTLVILGDTASQSSYTVGGAPANDTGVITVSGGNVRLSGLTLANTTGGARASNLSTSGCVVTLDHVTFAGSATTAYHLVASSGSVAIVNPGCIWAQSGISAWTALDGGVINQFANCTTSGSPVWSEACAVAFNCSVIAFGNGGGWTFTNTGATGPRYHATMNGVINVGGSGATYFPGNSAGSTATGGQYA